jgi:hypothetical protein
VPPPAYDELWITGTWAGICSDGVYREYETTRKLSPPYPDVAGIFSYEGDTDPPFFLPSVVFSDEMTDASVYWGQPLPLGFAKGESFLPPMDQTQPIDSGVLNAETTFPADQTCTFRFWTPAS